MIRFRSPRLLPYALIASGGAIASLAIGRIEPFLLAIPFLVFLMLAAWAGRTRPEVDVRITVDRTKVLEGDIVEFAAAVVVRAGSFTVALMNDLGDGLELVDPPSAEVVRAGSPATMRGRVRCRTWGIHAFGGARIQIRDPLSAFVYEQLIEPSIVLRVYPRPESLRSMLRPHALRPRLGSLVSRAAGDGLEYADIREFAQGDENRRINWKATARRSRLQTNLFYPEWSSDAVLLLDTFTDVGDGGESSLGLAVRGATAIAMQCLRRRDRVGLLTIGGTVQWLLPGMGMRQLYRIVDSLMQTQLAFSYAWPNAEIIPKRVIPPGALVICLSTLADRRMSGILLDLRARGHDVAVVEIAADDLLPLPVTERERLAHRLWMLHRDAMRHRYLQRGLPVSVWVRGRPLQIPITELQRFRRTSRRVHA